MIADFLITNITAIIAAVGYIGIFFLMTAESTLVPLPSELIMPFAGFLVADGKMSFILALLFATLGSLFGSFISYFIGYKGRHFFIRTFGRLFLLDKSHLLKSEKMLEKFGPATIFFARFIPGVRHVISLPAGFGKMHKAKFALFTFIGAGIWNAILLSMGYILGKSWRIIYNYIEIIDLIIIFIVVCIIVYWVFAIRKRKLALSKKSKK